MSAADGDVSPFSNDDATRRAGGRDWRRVHHSPLFWIGIALSPAAILIYVLTDDLSWRPAAR